MMENIKMAFSSLRQHKMRSFLTMLGIIIGVGAVIAIVAIGQGGELVLKENLAGETNTVSLLYVPSEEELMANASSVYEDAFTDEDVRLLEGIPEISNIVTSSTEAAKIRHLQEQADSVVIGMNQAYLDIYEIEVVEGRNLFVTEFLSGTRVGIVTDSVKEDLFDDEDVSESLVGKVIYVNEQPIEIIGVAESESGLFALSSNTVYLPMATWQNVFNKRTITELSLQTEKAEDLEIAGKKAADLLNDVHNTENSYQVLNMEELAQGLGQITRIMTIIISSIAGVSLLVGGIGVMNIMLVSVTERTREVGIRMSLGATRGQILFQFLVEAVVLTLTGGLIGMVLGTGASFIVSHFAGWPPLVSVPVIIGGILFSMVVGIVFGILPANKAASLNPVEALRYE